MRFKPYNTVYWFYSLLCLQEWIIKERPKKWIPGYQKCTHCDVDTVNTPSQDDDASLRLDQQLLSQWHGLLIPPDSGATYSTIKWVLLNYQCLVTKWIWKIGACMNYIVSSVCATWSLGWFNAHLIFRCQDSCRVYDCCWSGAGQWTSYRLVIFSGYYIFFLASRERKKREF